MAGNVWAVNLILACALITYSVSNEASSYVEIWSRIIDVAGGEPNRAKSI